MTFARLMKLAGLFPLFVAGLFAQPTNPTILAVVNSADSSATIGPNTWVTIYGENLAFPGDARPWKASDFTKNQMPTALDGVSVTFNGEPGYVAYVSPTQVNVLTPADLVAASLTDGGGVTVEVDYVGVGAPIPGCTTLATYNGSCYNSYAPCLSGETCVGNVDGFTCDLNGNCSPATTYSSVSPAFFTFNGTDVVAEHANGNSD